MKSQLLALGLRTFIVFLLLDLLVKFVGIGFQFENILYYIGTGLIQGFATAHIYISGLDKILEGKE